MIAWRARLPSYRTSHRVVQHNATLAILVAGCMENCRSPHQRYLAGTAPARHFDHMTTTYEIIPIAEEHIPSFREALDVVAREKKFLAFLEAPPLEDTRRFILKNIELRHPQFVALNANTVVGWCDVIPNRARIVYAHCGTLGIGLLPEFRGKGIGRKLMQRLLMRRSNLESPVSN